MISNIIVQVIERHIIHGLNDIFNIVNLVGMNDLKVKIITEKDKESKSKWLPLNQKLRDIEEVYEVCQRTVAKKGL
ncbi:MAG: hypothetical protein M1839_006751 [Geoglossum umbratile]|nr:MAG: hypothetical protein M1839_006751 [Geoglossum umbratile]